MNKFTWVPGPGIVPPVPVSSPPGHLVVPAGMAGVSAGHAVTATGMRLVVMGHGEPSFHNKGNYLSGRHSILT